MELIKNNFRALAIHLCSIPISLIGLFIFVSASPLYRVESVSIVVMIILYLSLFFLYETTLIHYLKLSPVKEHDYLSGILVALVGTIIWSIIYFSYVNCFDVFQENEIWIPYNAYIFLLWPISYTIKNHQALLVIGVLNGIFAPIALLIKRSRAR